MVTGITEHLQLVITCNNNSLLISLWHALSLLSALCFHQFSGNGFQRRTFSFPWVLDLSLCLSHSNSLLTPTPLLLSYEESLQVESLYANQKGYPACKISTQILQETLALVFPPLRPRKKTPFLCCVPRLSPSNESCLKSLYLATAGG
jgi:hypothetical protein